MSGLTVSGFNKKNFGDIKTDIENTLLDSFGTINLNEESVFGQLVGIFAEREASLWYALETVYNSMYPDTANDFSLDNVCRYIGVVRLEATPTTVIAELVGTNQTIIPINSEVAALGIDTVFRLDKNVLLTNLDCLGARVDINFTINLTYIVTINNDSYTYVAGNLDVKADVINDLVQQINTAAIGVLAANENDILVLSSTNELSFAFTHNANMFIVSIQSEGNFTSIIKGNIALPAGVLTIIQSPIGGWISVYNNEAGLTGRNLETDIELRIRRNKSLKLAGAGTIEALRARILNISDVTAATIIENITDLTSVDGLPPHSFEALVLGGSDQNIGNVIWKTKPAGIRSYGNVEVNVNDSTGRQQVVYFSRPVNLYIYVNIALVTNVLYPTNGDSVIKNNIVAQIMSLEVGEDVIYQSLYQSIYNVEGITSATITIGGTLIENTPPTLSSSNVLVGTSQIAVTDIAKINIT